MSLWFVSRNRRSSGAAGPLTYLQNIKYRMAKTRYVTYVFVSVWKVIVFFGMMVLISYFRLSDFQALFRDIKPSFSNHTLVINEVSAAHCTVHSSRSNTAI